MKHFIGYFVFLTVFNFGCRGRMKYESQLSAGNYKVSSSCSLNSPEGELNLMKVDDEAYAYTSLLSKEALAFGFPSMIFKITNPSMANGISNKNGNYNCGGYPTPKSEILFYCSGSAEVSAPCAISLMPNF